MGVLNKINSPSELKSLNMEDLKVLAKEIRKKIIEVVEKSGGHLAPNLGVVELTIALHRVFDAPKDKIIWDVGHQSYAHKLLTGRRESFHTLRQYGGISGFPSPFESRYDAFGTGHSSTSISAALGMACSRDYTQDDYKIVAVIGDGALTGGMSYEALNQTGYLKKDIIVILNDNSMSISKNVGAMSNYLSKIITKPIYNRFKDDVWELLGKLPPALSSKTRGLASKITEDLKNLFVPSGLFEELGFRYFGPLDGHNLDLLIKTFQNIKRLKGPILLHVLTKKGKGHDPAENNPSKFHGVGPNMGKSLPKRETYTDVFAKSIIELAQKDKKIVAITAAMPDGTGLIEFSKRFPERFFDVGIAEQHAVTFAAGLAISGYKPICAIYSTFLQRAYDQVIHDVCLQKLPVTFCIDRGGVVGEDGSTHHGAFDLSYLRLVPNLIIMAPKDKDELKDMLFAATTYKDGPVAIRYPKGEVAGEDLKKERTKLNIGEAEILVQGKDVCLIGVGSMVCECISAASMLKKDGISVEVINIRFIKPLDKKLLSGVFKRIKRVLTVEENVLTGGFGSAIMEFLTEEELGDVQLKRIGFPDKFIEHGPRNLLLEKYGLKSEHIAQIVKEWI